MTAIPAAVRAMAARGPDWSAWVQSLPSVVAELLARWGLRADGTPTHGHCSLVVPVRDADGVAAVLKVGFPDEESEHEHLGLRRWNGDGAVRLLGADPHRRALLLERLESRDLSVVPDEQACRVVGALYGRLHVPALPTLRPLSGYLRRWTADLARLPRGGPIPRRLVEQAVAIGSDLASDRSVPDRVLHTDLHYANVLAGRRAPWLAIDPKPVNGDPHYEVAPMLWNRWPELGGDVRAGVRRRFAVLVETAGLDGDRARDWVIVRMAHNAMWACQADGDPPDPAWLTTCVAIAKAVAP